MQYGEDQGLPPMPGTEPTPEPKKPNRLPALIAGGVALLLVGALAGQGLGKGSDEVAATGTHTDTVASCFPATELANRLSEATSEMDGAISAANAFDLRDSADHADAAADDFEAASSLVADAGFPTVASPLTEAAYEYRQAARDLRAAAYSMAPSDVDAATAHVISAGGNIDDAAAASSAILDTVDAC